MRSLRAFLRKVLLLDMLQGLAVTLRLYFSRKVTIAYPEKVKTPATLFRGLLRLHRDDQGQPLCIACKLCQNKCPTNCFDIEGQREGGTKPLRPVKYDWTLVRCTFCGLCVEVCPTDAIRFSETFRMSSLGKDKLLFHHDDMYLRGEELQDYLCAECLK
jgi:NADH-quinone oxidoreductase subunit I